MYRTFRARVTGFVAASTAIVIVVACGDDGSGTVIVTDCSDTDVAQSEVVEGGRGGAGGSKGTDIDGGTGAPIVVCRTRCDCADNNPCTLNECSDGKCINLNVDQVSCQSSPGTCRGGWCCSGESSCFEPYASDPNECADVDQ